jgi:hypothetical protein
LIGNIKVLPPLNGRVGRSMQSGLLADPHTPPVDKEKNKSSANEIIYQIILVLEGVVEIGDPASISAYQDVPLFMEAGGFGPFEHDPFVEDLHGVDSLRVSQLDDAHFAKGTATDHFDDVEVVARQTQTLDARHHRFHCASERREKCKRQSDCPSYTSSTSTTSFRCCTYRDREVRECKESDAMATAGHVLSVPIGRIDSSLTCRIVNARAVEAKEKKKHSGGDLVSHPAPNSKSAGRLAFSWFNVFIPPFPPPSQTSFLGYFIGPEGSRRHYDPAVSI